MKKIVIGIIIGLVLGFVAGTLFWLSQLPGAPSQYEPRFPLAEETLPNDAKYSGNGTVGFDFYTNPKASPELRKNSALPARKTSSWSTSSQRSGKYTIDETLWIEYGGKLYQVGQFDKEYQTQPNRELSMTRVISVDKARQITERIIVPDLDIDETFGPFPLP